MKNNVIMTSLPVANATVVLSPASVVKNTRLKYEKIVLTGLGIAEVVIGSLAIAFSCVLLVYGSDSYGSDYPDYMYNDDSASAWYHIPSLRFSTGEGIWCGVWILIGGALGIASGRKLPTLCLINCHLGFSIVAAIFSAVLFSMGIVTALVDSAPMWIALESILAVGGLTSFILCIVSAVYCCKLTSSAGMQSCCGPCCTEQATPIQGGQVMHMTSPQSHQQIQQTVVQSYPPTLSAHQGSYPGNFVTVMQPGVAASNQPTLFAQQPVFVCQHQVHVGQQPANATQQPAPVSQQQQTFPLLEQFQRPGSEHKRQETLGSSVKAATSADHGDSPPPYFEDH